MQEENVASGPWHTGVETLHGATLQNVLARNTAVQPVCFNFLVKSQRIGSILHILHQSRPGAYTLLRPIASAGLLSITDDAIVAVETRGSLLADDLLKGLRVNSTHGHER